jgi:hypothetical protein
MRPWSKSQVRAERPPDGRAARYLHAWRPASVNCCRFKLGDDLTRATAPGSANDRHLGVRIGCQPWWHTQSVGPTAAHDHDARLTITTLVRIKCHSLREPPLCARAPPTGAKSCGTSAHRTNKNTSDPPLRAHQTPQQSISDDECDCEMIRSQTKSFAASLVFSGTDQLCCENSTKVVLDEQVPAACSLSATSGSARRASSRRAPETAFSPLYNPMPPAVIRIGDGRSNDSENLVQELMFTTQI